MVKTTRAQRETLFRLYNRTDRAIPYREFRKSVLATYFMGGCVMLPIFGIWIGIESDGYAHS